MQKSHKSSDMIFRMEVMQSTSAMWCVAAAMLLLAAGSDARPSSETDGRGPRVPRDTSACRPDPTSPLLEQRTLCPFSKELLVLDNGVRVQKAVLKPGCEDAPCGQRGSCTPVHATISVAGGRGEDFAVAYVCAWTDKRISAGKSQAPWEQSGQ